MEFQNASKPQWSQSGLLGLLRTTLQSPESHGRPDPLSPPRRLTSAQLAALADQWRNRSGQGDVGAESVAQALELVAMHRQDKQKRIQAMGRRISALMGLN